MGPAIRIANDTTLAHSSEQPHCGRATSRRYHVRMQISDLPACAAWNRRYIDIVQNDPHHRHTSWIGHAKTVLPAASIGPSLKPPERRTTAPTFHTRQESR